MNRLLIVLFFFGLGCSLSSSKKNLSSLTRLPLPTKDEVAIVDGTSFTIADLFAIKGILRTPSTEAAYWVGISSLALVKDFQKRGAHLSLLDASILSRYALNDLSELEANSVLKHYFAVSSPSLPSSGEIKRTIDAITAQAFIQKSFIPLSSL